MSSHCRPSTVVGIFHSISNPFNNPATWISPFYNNEKLDSERLSNFNTLLGSCRVPKIMLSLLSSFQRPPKPTPHPITGGIQPPSHAPAPMGWS